MEPEKLKEAKDFTRNSGIFAIVCWIFSIFLIYKGNDKTADISSIVMVGAVILSFIYFMMKKTIKQYEDGRKND
jgi:uncharacterized membrane protein